jgi:hypothetical protein
MQLYRLGQGKNHDYYSFQLLSMQRKAFIASIQNMITELSLRADREMQGTVLEMAELLLEN